MNTLAEVAQIVVAVLLMAITLVGVIPSWRERLFRWFPQISVHFENPGRGNQNSFVQLRPLRVPVHAAGWFFRLGIKNSGIASLNDADVQIVRIEKVFNGRRYNHTTFSPMELHWASAQGDSSRNIYSDEGISDYVDVVHALNGVAALLLFVKNKHLNAGNNIALPRGQYYLHLRVVGKTNLPLRPTKAIVYVDWGGNWENVEFQLLESVTGHQPPVRDYSQGDHWVEHAGFIEIPPA